MKDLCGYTACVLVAMAWGLALAPTASAQPAHNPTEATSSMGMMNMSGMTGMSMDMPEMEKSGDMQGQGQPSSPSVSNAADAGYQKEHKGKMEGMHHMAMPAMKMPPQQSTHRQDQAPSRHDGGMPDMTMKGVGGRAPSGPRSPDYSDGIGYGRMPGMTMHGDAALGKVMFDQLEAFRSDGEEGQRWDMQAWYGKDFNKVWLRSEGEHRNGELGAASVEALWYHAILPFWGTQLGLRQDLGEGPSRTWAAFGIQGLAPYFFDVEATGYVGESGRLAARLEVSYELLFTQRLILQPELEVNFYSKNDPARAIGKGLASAEFGLRLRYEFRRRFAPYLGINWIRLSGQTADYAQLANQPIRDRQIVAGIRIWL